ncbi:MAG: helix-turn-helix transcriptional regulator [Pirellulales bacterium]|nr:helix-turn-helix transcriptional regulator [Pirellulales bacterium]
MDARTRARYEARAKIVKAMAHPSRLLILDELARRNERCVCELTELIGADMSTVSKHLSLLKNAGLVDVEKRGTQIWYRLRCTCITDFFRCVESVIKRNAAEQQRILRR